jgi:hypothetical protein
MFQVKFFTPNAGWIWFVAQAPRCRVKAPARIVRHGRISFGLLGLDPGGHAATRHPPCGEQGNLRRERSHSLPESDKSVSVEKTSPLGRRAQRRKPSDFLGFLAIIDFCSFAGGVVVP